MSYVKTSRKQKFFLILLGVFLSCFLLEAILYSFGRILLFNQNKQNNIAFKQKSSYRILCLGESTTAYQYPNFLEESLNKRTKNNPKFTVIDRGVPGTNSSIIVSMLEENLNKFNPDIVVVMMGINDSIHNLVGYGLGSEDGIVTNIFNNLKILKLARYLYYGFLSRMERGKVGNINMSEYNFDYVLYGGVSADKDDFEKMDNISLSLSYVGRKEYDKAEKILKEEIAKNPENSRAYVALGTCYRKMRDMREDAEAILKQGLKEASDKKIIKLILGVCYRKWKRHEESETIFKELIKEYPRFVWAYIELGRSYYQQGKRQQERDVYLKIEDMKLQNDIIYSFLAYTYYKQGKYDLAEQYSKQAEYFQLQQYKLLTERNFRKIRNALNERGIRFVCVQYPMRSINPLKKIFDYAEGIIFVDNEDVFKEKVFAENYEDYFKDRFAGDFGHCTDKGNRLLAISIADEILKNIGVIAQ